MFYLIEVYIVYINLMSLLFIFFNEEDEDGGRRNYGKLFVLRTLIYCYRFVFGVGSFCFLIFLIWFLIWYFIILK